MRVMIINPRFHLPIDTRITPHLGLAYLAAVSEQRGDEVLLYDADVEDEPITGLIKRFDPQVIGITARPLKQDRFCNPGSGQYRQLFPGTGGLC